MIAMRFTKVLYRSKDGRVRVALENPPLEIRRWTLAVLKKLPGKKVIDTEDAAEAAGCDRTTVIRHVNAGKLKPTQRGHGFHYTVAEVVRWIEAEPQIQIKQHGRRANMRMGRPRRQQ